MLPGTLSGRISFPACHPFSIVGRRRDTKAVQDVLAKAIRLRRNSGYGFHYRANHVDRLVRLRANGFQDGEYDLSTV